MRCNIMESIQFQIKRKKAVSRCIKTMYLVSCQSAIVIIIAQLLFICHLQYKLLLSQSVNEEILKQQEHRYLQIQNNSVDVVFTWVNGSDPKFLKQLHNYRNNMVIKDHVNSDRRFNNKNELKYALRSIDKNMPWIRHVFIVTNGQVPNWLDLDNGFVTIIPHEMIFPNKSLLPTFSSPAIEANIHRIPGLSKHFLYFNDDWLVAKPVDLSIFHSPTEGMLSYWVYEMRNCSRLCSWSMVNDGNCHLFCNVPECNFDGDDCHNKSMFLPEFVHNILKLHKSPYDMSLQTTHRVFNKKFGYNLRHIPPHMPLLFNKDILANAWMDFPQELMNTSAHKFRDNWDMQFQFFYMHYVRERKERITFKEALKMLDKNKDGRINYAEILNLRAISKEYTKFDKIFNFCFSTSGKGINLKLTIDEMSNCTELKNFLQDTLLLKHKYKFNPWSQVPGRDFYHIILMRSNYEVLKQRLNNLRARPATLICINDDLDHNPESGRVNQMIYKELEIFYEGMFPLPSKYELPNRQINDFNYLYERGISNFNLSGAIYHKIVEIVIFCQEFDHIESGMFCVVLFYVIYMFYMKCNCLYVSELK